MATVPEPGPPPVAELAASLAALARHTAPQASTAPEQESPTRDRNLRTPSQYELKGKNLHYHCPSCANVLISNVDEGGVEDTCPHCDAVFIVPGREESLRCFSCNYDLRGTSTVSKQCPECGAVIDTGLGMSLVQRRVISGKKPVWVIVMLGVYGLFVIAILLSSLGAVGRGATGIIANPGSTTHDELVEFIIGIVFLGLIILSQFLLLYMPIRVASRRPLRQGPLIITAMGTGLLAGLLILGAGMAIADFLRSQNPWPYLIIALATWFAWSVIFALASSSRNPASFAVGLYQWIIAGSIIEMLVAVPCHIIVRRRNICSAGFLSFFGICTGIGVMILAFGPAVLILYSRRILDIQPSIERHLTEHQKRLRIGSWTLGVMILLGILTVLLAG